MGHVFHNCRTKCINRVHKDNYCNFVVITYGATDNLQKNVYRVLTGDPRVASLRLIAGGVTVLEQDTLSAAKYWFNPGNRPEMTEKLLTWT